jgi:hypothetical protein
VDRIRTIPNFPAPSNQQPQQPTGAVVKRDLFAAQKIVDSPRYHLLARLASYSECTQHNWKQFDFEGRRAQAGTESARFFGQPLMSTEKVGFYVPTHNRRPSAPQRTARVINDGFTNLVFGDGRFPKIIFAGDDDATDYAEATIAAGGIAGKMIRARGLGGNCGTVGVSWRWIDGEPRIECHPGKGLYVHEWFDRDALICAHVTEVYKFSRTIWDAQRKRVVKEIWWQRRDWTLDADIVYKAVKDDGTPPIWEHDEQRSVTHNDGRCHLEWIQNLPSEEEDGIEDYAGLYEIMDQIDVVGSIVCKGAACNLDPTLVLRIDPELVPHAQVKKGSDNALVVGKDGDAHYMEVGGTSITAGLQLLDDLKRSAYETAQWVVVDPDKIAAAGTSAVAIKALYSPALAKAGVLREQYGRAIRRIIEGLVESARKHSTVTPVSREDGVTELVRGAANLPPKMIERDEVDAEGNPITVTEWKARTPGQGGQCTLVWGPWFAPTSTDRQQLTQTLSVATGGASFIPRSVATEIAATEMGLDARRLKDELEREIAADRDRRNAEFDLGLQPVGVDVPGFTQPEDQEPAEAEPGIVVGEQVADVGDLTNRFDGFNGALEGYKKNNFQVDQHLVEQLAAMFGIPAPTLAATTKNSKDFYGYELEGGVFTIDEVRAAKGLPPLPDGKGSMTVPEANAAIEAANPAPQPAFKPRF